MGEDHLSAKAQVIPGQVINQVSKGRLAQKAQEELDAPFKETILLDQKIEPLMQGPIDHLWADKSIRI